MKNIFLVFLYILTAKTALGLTPKGVGEYEHAESKEISLKNDIWHVVPECKFWLIQDVNNLNAEKWLEIDGIIEFTTWPGLPDAALNYMRGKFTFSSGPKELEYKAVLHPGTKVHVRSLSNNGSQGIYEFSTVKSIEECNKGITKHSN